MLTWLSFLGRTKDDAVWTCLKSYTDASLGSWQPLSFQLLYVNYTGVVTMGPAEQAVFGGSAGDGATPFGNSCKSIQLVQRY